MWRIFYIDPPAGGRPTSRRRRDFFFDFFSPIAILFWCISFGNDLFREVVVEKIDFLYNFFHFLAIFANFWSFFAIFTLFGAFSLCTVGAFFVIFPIFLGFVGIFWGTPANYFADFGAILAIFINRPLGPHTSSGRATAPARQCANHLMVWAEVV